MFNSILGHDRVKQQLALDIEHRRFHQSYLFSGPDHIGKMTLLREFVGALRPGTFVAGKGPGLLIFLDDGESMAIEQIRAIADFAKFRHAKGEYSCCVIEHVERLSTPAANAFLKILEEPNPGLIFFLTSKTEQKLLPTIRSRLAIFRMTGAGEKSLQHFLQGKTSDPLLVSEVLKLSGGRVGLALSLLEDPVCLDRLRKLLDYSALVCSSDLPERFSLAEIITGKDFSEEDRGQFLIFLGQRLRSEDLRAHHGILFDLQKISRLFADTNVNKRLWLEELFLRLV